MDVHTVTLLKLFSKFSKTSKYFNYLFIEKLREIKKVPTVEVSLSFSLLLFYEVSYFFEYIRINYALWLSQATRKFAHYSLAYVLIGGHLVRYPWSAISDWAWYRNFRYRTERAESDIISDIGIDFYPISDIRHLSTYK